MFELQNIENHSEKNENKLQLIELQINALDKEIAEFLIELNVTPQKITKFLENEDNFTPENWETLQREKKSLDEKLQMKLKNIPNPRKAKQTQTERRIGTHWLFVK